jgi:hypothetical protein
VILAALLLVAIGLVDAFRPLVRPRRSWLVVGAIAVIVLIVGALSDAVLPALAAAVGLAAWAVFMRADSRSGAGFWPVVGLAAVVAVALAVGPSREAAGWLGTVWSVPSPGGGVAFDQGMLVLGVVLFLAESANSVVRVALATEGVAHDTSPPGVASDQQDPDVPVRAVTDGADDPVDPAPGAAQPSPRGASGVPAPPALKGGRLIGPIERVIVFSLTLAAAYPLLAAFIAAKGIVRFPEISRDSAVGNRAEYFLIGSLVSWLQGLAGAFAVWWAFAA